MNDDEQKQQKKWKPDYNMTPAFGNGAAAEPVKIAEEGALLPIVQPERDPTALAKISKANREYKQKQDLVERLTSTEYKHHHTAKRALETAGYRADNFDCPYAIEQRYSSNDSSTLIWKIVDDSDHVIKGAQMAHKKNLVGREYGSADAARNALTRKGHKLADPRCPYRLVKVAPTLWRIDIKMEAEDLRLEVKKLLRTQLLFLTDPDPAKQEKALDVITAQIHDIYK